MKLVFLKHVSLNAVILTGLLFELAACGGGGSSGTSANSSAVVVQKSSLALSSSQVPVSSPAAISSAKSSMVSLSSSSKLATSSLPAKLWGEARYLDKVPESYYGVKNPRFAASPDGILTLAWLENGIWVNQYSPTAGWAATPTQLATHYHIDSISTGPLVVADNKGNVFVAWTAVMGIRHVVCVARYSPTLGWPPVTVFVNDRDYSVYDFSLAVNKRGDAVLAWSDWGSGNRIIATRYTVDEGWSAQAQIGSPSINTAFVRAQLNELGDILVGWHDEYASFKYALNVATYTRASGWSGVQELARDDFGGDGSQMWPELAVDTANSIWLFWRKQGDIWSSKFSEQNGISTPLNLVDIAYPNEILAVAVAAGEQGDLRLVWSQKFHANLAQISTKSYTQENAWGANKVLMSTGINSAPTLTIAANGDTQVLWALPDGGVHQFDSVYFNADASQISAVQPVIYSAWGGLQSLNTVVDSGGNRWATGVADEGGETRIWLNQYK